MAILLQWTTVALAALAAVFWLLSALVKIPDIMDTKLGGKGSITDIMQHQARLSAAGASCAALSALAQIGYTLCTMTSSNA